jgi:peptidoglycan/LPS O-acetylase OafA/YrhL
MVKAALDTADETPMTARSPDQPLKHVPILDSVRGVAILTVVFFHATVFTMDANAISGFDRVYLNVLSSGWCGVDMFFVLSGFLITRILLHSKTQEGYFRNFYARRVLRIFPLYYIAVIVYLVLALFFHLQYARASAPWLLTYTSNLIVAFDPSFVIPLPMGHFWSLAIEEQFYLFWPLIVFALSKRRLLWVCAMLFILAFVVRYSMIRADNLFGAYRFTLCRLDSLALGGVAAVLVTAPNRSLIRGWSWAVLGLSGGVLVAIVIWRDGFAPEDATVVAYGISFLALFFAAALFLLVSRSGGASPVGRVNATLSIFGRYAYGMYVFHQPLATAVLRLKGARLMPLIYGSQVPFQILFVVLFCGCTLLIAMISFNLIEKRFLRLKSFFEYVTPRRSGPVEGRVFGQQHSKRRSPDSAK